MSEELPPPTLRLKPRSRPEIEPVSSSLDSPAGAAEPIVASTIDVEAPKLRLRPKLGLDPAPEASLPAELAPSPAEAAVTAPVISLKPRLKLDSLLAPTEASEVRPTPLSHALAPAISSEPVPSPVEPPKFKLKQKTADAAQAAVIESPASAAPPPVPAASFPPPVPKPTAPTEPFPAAAPSAPAVEAAAAKRAPFLPPPVPKPSAKSGKSPQIKKGPTEKKPAGKLVMVLIAVVIIGGAYFGYQKFSPTPLPPVATAPEVSTRPSTPSATLNEISTLPARAIDKAEAVIATVQENERLPVDEVVAPEGTGPALPLRPKPAPSAAKPIAPTTATTQLAPGITAISVAQDVSGEASVAFRSWVAQARISGVFQGTPARVLINGRTIGAGQTVDEVLAITFDGIDPVTKTLVFRDATGATVARKF